MKKHNFSAGPCILPQEVLKQASDAILNFNNDNLSLIEISHRSKPFVDVMDKAVELVKELLNVPKGYSVIFLQGGASINVPLFINEDDKIKIDTEKGAYIERVKQ